MDTLLAERPLYGWHGHYVRLFAWEDEGIRTFMVVLVQPANVASQTLYEGTSFEDASNAYVHPFVTNNEQVTALVG